MAATIQYDVEGDPVFATAIVPINLSTNGSSQASAIAVANGLTGGVTFDDNFVHSMGSDQQAAGSSGTPVWSVGLAGPTGIIITHTAIGSNSMEAGSAEVCQGPNFTVV